MPPGEKSLKVDIGGRDNWGIGQWYRREGGREGGERPGRRERRLGANKGTAASERRPNYRQRKRGIDEKQGSEKTNRRGKDTVTDRPCTEQMDQLCRLNYRQSEH